VETIILYSDSCVGKNQNLYSSDMFFTIFENKTSIQQQNHKFLIK